MNQVLIKTHQLTKRYGDVPVVNQLDLEVRAGEIYEYTIDCNFGTRYQGVGIHDTMRDIILDALGALIFALLLYFQGKRKFQPIRHSNF